MIKIKHFSLASLPLPVLEGFLRSTWVIGWYIYQEWLSLCFQYYVFYIAFYTALFGGDWYTSQRLAEYHCDNIISWIL